ncbi:translation machinery-associated protein 16 [Pseudogymnoascus australis]
MAKGLMKTRKKINKKGSDIHALHENSRDSMRLRRASNRDEKLKRVGTAKRKDNQPLIVRAAYFQEAVRRNGGKELTMEQITPLIEEYVHQNDEEFSEVKSQRRAGRPASTREDVLRIKIAKDEKEWENGFCQYISCACGSVANTMTDLPDLTIPDNAVYLDRWDGTWSYLPTLKWVTIAKNGT